MFSWHVRTFEGYLPVRSRTKLLNRKATIVRPKHLQGMTASGFTDEAAEIRRGRDYGPACDQPASVVHWNTVNIASPMLS